MDWNKQLTIFKKKTTVTNMSKVLPIFQVQIYNL